MKSIMVVALAASASAYINGELLRREVLHARQTSITTSYAAATTTAAASGGSDQCNSVLQGLATLITGLPTPTGDLSSFLATAASTLTDACSLSIPASIAPAFSTYESSVLSFYSAHITQIESALSACPTLTSLVNNPVCSTAVAGSTVTSTAVSTKATTVASTAAGGNGTFSASTSPLSPSPTLAPSTAAPKSPSSSVSSAGGPRETGMVAVAMVAAGFLGVVAAAL